MVGCTEHESRHPLLDAAERLTASCPDSVIRLLDSQNGYVSREDSMRHTLLYTEALQGVGLDRHDETDIVALKNYYEKTGNNYRMARALLCLARHSLRQGHLLQVFRHTWEAEERAAGNARIGCQAAYLQGLANLMAGCPHHAVTAFRRSVQLNAPSNRDTLQWARSLCMLARAYNRSGNRDSFLQCMKQVETLPHVEGSEVSTEISINIAVYALRMGREEEALLRLRHANERDLTRRSSYYLGNIYASKGWMHHAEKEWYDAAASADYAVRMAALDSLVKIKPHDNFVIHAYVECFRNGMGRTSADEVTAIQQVRQQEQARRESEYRVIIFLSVVIVMLVVLLMFFVYHRKRVRFFRRSILTAQQRYLSDLEAYNRAKAEIDRLQQRIAGYQEDETVTKRWNIEEMLLSEHAVYALHAQASRGMEATEEQWSNLLELVSERDKGLVRLLSGREDLTDREQRVCILVRLRFLPGEMGALLGLSAQSVTNLRQRLLLKMFGESGGARRFDECVRAV